MLAQAARPFQTCNWLKQWPLLCAWLSHPPAFLRHRLPLCWAHSCTPSGCISQSRHRAFPALCLAACGK